MKTSNNPDDRRTWTFGITGGVRTFMATLCILSIFLIAKQSFSGWPDLLDDEDASLLSKPGRDVSQYAPVEKVQPHTGYKKVLVTGGAGFIGSHVAEALLSRGDDVIIVDEMNDYYDVGINQQNLKLTHY